MIATVKAKESENDKKKYYDMNFLNVHSIANKTL